MAFDSTAKQYEILLQTAGINGGDIIYVTPSWNIRDLGWAYESIDNNWTPFPADPGFGKIESEGGVITLFSNGENAGTLYLDLDDIKVDDQGAGAAPKYPLSWTLISIMDIDDEAYGEWQMRIKMAGSKYAKRNLRDPINIEEDV